MKKVLVAMMVGLLASTVSASVMINEIRIDMPSTDNDEYFELAGTPSESLDGLTYLVLGDSTAGVSGVIECVLDLTGQSLPADDGILFVACNPGKIKRALLSMHSSWIAL